MWGNQVVSWSAELNWCCGFSAISKSGSAGHRVWAGPLGHCHCHLLLNQFGGQILVTDCIYGTELRICSEGREKSEWTEHWPLATPTYSPAQETPRASRIPAEPSYALSFSKIKIWDLDNGHLHHLFSSGHYYLFSFLFKTTHWEWVMSLEYNLGFLKTSDSITWRHRV